jgi:hypothetical protein
MTASGVLSTRPGSVRCSAVSRSVMCRAFIVCTTNPSSARIVFHASVRMRKLVKNGAMTRTSSVAFHLPDRKAMKYASG